jgi:hypothetical protein
MEGARLPLSGWIRIGFNADSDPELFISTRIRIRIQLFITNAEPDPEPGSQTNADSCRSVYGPWSDFKVTKS